VVQVVSSNLVRISALALVTAKAHSPPASKQTPLPIMCSQFFKEWVEDTFDGQGVSTDILEEITHKDTCWYWRAAKLPSTTKPPLPDLVKQIVLGGFMPKMIKCLHLEANEWNKVCALFETYCKMAPEVVVPEMVPCICATLCHITWKTDSVFNEESHVFRAGAAEELGRWIIQQGYAKTVVPVTQNTVIQLEARILITLGWHLDPPNSHDNHTNYFATVHDLNQRTTREQCS